MRVLMKFLGYFMLVLLAGAILAALTALAWWQNWPLLTGAVIMVGLLGLVLLFFGLRTLFRWRNKQAFVKRVLSEQRQQESGGEGGFNSLYDVWRRGLHVLDASPLRAKAHPRYSQPWYLALDATGGTPLFDAFGRNIPEHKAQAPVGWHFLSGAIILRTAASLECGVWESFLTLLVNERRKMSLRGLMLIVSSRDLRQWSTEKRREQGREFRDRAQQVMLALGRRFPVYVLVQDLETLPGMAELGERLPGSVTERPLGCLMEEAEADYGRYALERAVKSLTGAIRTAAVDGIPPHGDELAALEELPRIGECLEDVLEQVFTPVPHQAVPLLRGIFFSFSRPLGEVAGFAAEEKRAAANAGPEASAAELPLPLLPCTPQAESSMLRKESPRPRFLSELLTKVLPAETQPIERLNSRFSLYASTKGMLMGAWLLLLLFVCGILGASTLYQHYVLTTPQATLDELSHVDSINELYERMTYARYLEHARTSWYLPTLGQDMIGFVERKVKTRFVQDSYKQLLLPSLDHVRVFLTKKNKKYVLSQELDIARQLRWLCANVAERVTTGSTAGVRNEIYPLTAFNEKKWTPLNTELMQTALDWTENNAQLEVLLQDLQQLMAYSLSSNGGNMLSVIADNIGEFSPASRICLSQFWPHLLRTPEADVCVPTKYTVFGHAKLQETLEDVLQISGGNASVKQDIQHFLDAYYREYAEAWHNFVIKSNAMNLDLLQGDVFLPYADMDSVAQMPQVLLLHRLSAELQPLSKHGKGADWIDNVELADAMSSLALLTAEDNSLTLWNTVLSLINASPETLAILRDNTKDTKHLRDVFRGIPELRQYYDQLLEIMHLLASPVQTLPLAATHYSMGEAGDLTQSPFTLAEKHLNKALKSIGGKTDNPGQTLLRGMLDLLAQGVTVQSARELQRLWENEVLSNPTYLYRSQDIEAMYGEKGIVIGFMNARLKPFLKRQGSNLAAASWGAMNFPFTADFLQSLSRAESVNSTPPRDTYTVLLRSQPTLVNVEARQRPDATTVSLQCPGKKMQLTNRNYPQEQLFEYSVAQCGETRLNIVFPSFTLSRSYAGFDAFLEEFQYGERQFTAADFPDQAEKLAAASIETITVRLLPDNIADVLERKNNTAPTLQDRITYVW